MLRAVIPSKKRALARFGLLCSLFAAGPGLAASLQISPVSIDLSAPTQTSTIDLRNDGDRPVNVQVRAFRWVQQNGQDQLIPTTDVVVSPPASRLKPGTTYTIRVARIAAPVRSGEESYRLLVDELPEINVKRPASTIDIAVRYSLPVFFSDRAASAELDWKLIKEGTQLIAEATNNGQRHAKIANLAATTSRGAISFGKGLNGYVLPGATRRWTVASGKKAVTPGSVVTITASGDDYNVNQKATVIGR